MTYDAIRAWADANRGNPTVAGAANDLFYNSLAANLSTSASVSYARQMMPLATQYQRTMQSIADESSLRTLAAEGSLLRGLTQQQGDIAYRSDQLNASTTRYGYDRQLDAAREQGRTQRYASDNDLRSSLAQSSAQRYGYDQQLRGIGLQVGAQRYESDRSVDRTRLETDAQRYGYDQQLRGVGLQTDAQRFESREATRRTGLETDAQRYGYDQQLRGVGLQTDAQRFESREATRRTGLETDAQRYGYDQQLRGVGLQTAAQRYESDRSVDRTRLETDAQRYGADRQLDGVRDTNITSTRNIRTTGDEDRKTLTQGTDETLRLRADARGAIRTTGKQFYG
jgi:hypothetical protein